MADINNTNAQATQQPDAAPAATGEQASTGKTFTQDEVNRIVSDRLARERAKAEPSAADTREHDLDARENKLKCRELAESNHYPKQLLEILDTSNSDNFKGTANKLMEAFPQLATNTPKPPQFSAKTPGLSPDFKRDAIAEAFKQH